MGPASRQCWHDAHSLILLDGNVPGPKAGGVVFCSFYTPNLSYWQSLGAALGQRMQPLPHSDRGQRPDPSAVYLLFETNEGDTPRILTSQFTSAWLSPNRGSVPVAWAVDPALGTMFPALWNFYASSATANDSWVAGVDGAGYVFLDSLGSHTEPYERHAATAMKVGCRWWCTAAAIPWPSQLATGGSAPSGREGPARIA